MTIGTDTDRRLTWLLEVDQFLEDMWTNEEGGDVPDIRIARYAALGWLRDEGDEYVMTINGYEAIVSSIGAANRERMEALRKVVAGVE